MHLLHVRSLRYKAIKIGFMFPDVFIFELLGTSYVLVLNNTVSDTKTLLLHAVHYYSINKFTRHMTHSV